MQILDGFRWIGVGVAMDDVVYRLVLAPCIVVRIAGLGIVYILTRQFVA